MVSLEHRIFRLRDREVTSSPLQKVFKRGGNVFITLFFFFFFKNEVKIKDIFETKLFQGKQKAKAIEKCAKLPQKNREEEKKPSNIFFDRVVCRAKVLAITQKSMQFISSFSG